MQQLLLSSFISNVLLLLTAFIISPGNNNNFVVVQAQERMVRFVFNNGNPPASWQTCTWQDNVLIDDIFRYRYNRRYLRNQNSNDNDLALNHSLVNDDDQTTLSIPSPHGSFLLANNDTAVVSQQQRELNTYPRYCRDNCAGYAQGCCRATNCIGYRRELKNDENNNIKYHNDSDRHLQVASCNTVMTAIQNKINDLVWNNRVSATCKSYLTAPIIKNCTDDVVYGVLESVRVWDVGNPWAPTQMFSFNANSLPASTVNYMPTSSFSFCRSRKITIEAVMNPCVMVTSFHMYHNQNWWSPAHINNMQTALPFSLYGNSGSQMNGMQWLNVGTYVLDIKPDWWIWKEKRIVFTVNNC